MKQKILARFPVGSNRRMQILRAWILVRVQRSGIQYGDIYADYTPAKYLHKW